MIVVYPMVGLRTDGARPLLFAWFLMTTSYISGCCAAFSRCRSVGYRGALMSASVLGIMLLASGLLRKSIDHSIEQVSHFRFSYFALCAQELIGFRLIATDPRSIPASDNYTKWNILSGTLTADAYLEAWSLPVDPGFIDEAISRI
eukprot:12629254-Heterocapsa_arctica.AAC.1